MESASVLESVAEVAIALAGFGGIAAGLGYRARGIWSSEDQLRLMLLALSGLMVVFACFLPFATHQLGSSTPWRAASTVILAIVACTLLYQVWFRRRGLPPGFSRIASLMSVSAQVVAFALLLMVVLGHAGKREPGFYLTATLVLLFQASLFFVRLLQTSFRSGDHPAA
jgi:hypothetical protein